MANLIPPPTGSTNTEWTLERPSKFIPLRTAPESALPENTEPQKVRDGFGDPELRQGQLGDGYVASALAALAARDLPSLLERVKPGSKADTYAVHLNDPETKEPLVVTVAVPRSMLADGVWNLAPGVKTNQEADQLVALQKAAGLVAANASSPRATTAIGVIMGAEPTRLEVKPSDKVFGQLDKAFDQGSLVIATTRAGQHATVITRDAKTNTFYTSNPWNVESGVRPIAGQPFNAKKVTEAEFARQFERVQIISTNAK